MMRMRKKLSVIQWLMWAFNKICIDSIIHGFNIGHLSDNTDDQQDDIPQKFVSHKSKKVAVIKRESLMLKTTVQIK